MRLIAARPTVTIGDREFCTLPPHIGSSAVPDLKNRPICPECQRSMTLELQRGGKSPRTFQCLDCERPDPLKSSDALRWLSSDLGRKE